MGVCEASTTSTATNLSDKGLEAADEVTPASEDGRAGRGTDGGRERGVRRRVRRGAMRSVAERTVVGGVSAWRCSATGVAMRERGGAWTALLAKRCGRRSPRVGKCGRCDERATRHKTKDPKPTVVERAAP